MKNKRSRFFDSNGFLLAVLVLAVLAPVFSYAARSNFVFVNLTVNFAHFTTVIISVMIANAIAVCVLAVLRLYGKADSTCKAYRVFFILTCVFTLVFMLAAVAYFCGMCMSESREVYLLYLQKDLRLGFVLLCLPVLALFVPKMPKKAKIAVCTLVLGIACVVLVNSMLPLTPYKMTSEPIVFDNGECYSVVFSTNDKGTAYVEYTYNGEDFRVFDATSGKIHTDKRIHSMLVPYAHLKNNTYRVGTVRVIEAYSYGSRMGKEIVSQDYTLTVNDTENQEYLVLSDWHTYTDRVFAATQHLGSFDAVILMGDASPGVDFEEQVITNIVQFTGELTHGSKPVIYARGNHETRGNYASELAAALGMDEFYYTVNMGDYSFVVLDSGEDKDDSHPEYGNTTDYNTYRADMVRWLSGVTIENEKIISLSHSWKISDVEKELSDAGWAELDRLGVRLMISGHTHQCRIIGEANDREQEVFAKYPHIVGYMDGGERGGDYVASKMTLSADGITLYACNMAGEEIFNTQLAWTAE